MPRNCSYCNFAGHDIRNCLEYVNHIDRRLIRDFTQNGNAAFPELPRRMIHKLGDKYGLSRNLTYNIYLERLMMIYIHLGEQRRVARDRQNQENRRMMEEQQRLPTLILADNSGLPVANVIVPFPLAPVVNRFRNILSMDDLNALRNSFQQLSLELETEVVQRQQVQVQINTPPVFVIDHSKFNEDSLHCECPICYENEKAVITNCDHRYCRSCIDSMIMHGNNTVVTCALCREKIDTIFVSA